MHRALHRVPAFFVVLGGLAWAACGESRNGTDGGTQNPAANADAGSDRDDSGLASEGRNMVDSGGSGGSGGKSDSGASGSGAGGMPSGGPCEEDTDCDDGVDCTRDLCESGRCVRAIDVKACAAGQSCHLHDGCTTGGACAEAADCGDDDPCTTHERCEESTAICRFDYLDRDGDGFPPVGCMGDDTDDSDSRAFPGTDEVCDGEDNDDDGDIDEEPAASIACGATHGEVLCVGGACKGCTTASDRAALAEQYDDLSVPEHVAQCSGNAKDGAAICVENRFAGVVSTGCLGCLKKLATCEQGCSCNSLGAEDCTPCVCETGCDGAYEGCSGLAYPFECPD